VFGVVEELKVKKKRMRSLPTVGVVCVVMGAALLADSTLPLGLGALAFGIILLIYSRTRKA